MIRVASYNIRKAVGTDRRRNPARILDVLREVEADIVVLQEADRRFGQRHAAIPVEMLRDMSNYRPAWINDNLVSSGWHGNAILVNSEIDVIEASIIPLPSLEPRGAIRADLRTILGPIRVIGMHLDLSGLRRRQQIRSILRHATEHKQIMPTILMGDCNEWSRHGGSLTEFSAFHCAETGPSFHSRRPIAKLDRIFACDRLSFNDAGCHHSLKARFASDHLPVWADVSIR